MKAIRSVVVVLGATGALVVLTALLEPGLQAHTSVPADLVRLLTFSTLALVVAGAGYHLRRSRSKAALNAAAAALADRLRNETMEELTRLSRELVTVQEAERRAIARELHDHFGQLLTALGLDLRLIEQGVGPPEQRRGQIARCIRSLDEVLHGLHHLAANLRPTTLEHLGLLEALRVYIESVRSQSGLEVQFEASSLAGERLSPETEIAVYRIVQEGLTNAVRHARATRVDVVLSRQAGQIATVIEDDGIGFDVTSAMSGGRLGLGGMRERATMLGGVLEIDTSPRHGTTLVARLPYAGSISDR